MKQETEPILMHSMKEEVINMSDAFASPTDTNISAMKEEMKPIPKPSKKQEVANLNDALAQMQRLGSIYFVKSLRRTAIRKYGETQNYAELTLPEKFVRDNCDKFEEWVTLRTQLSSGKSSRPWLVRLRVEITAAAVQISLGWHAFVSGNRLKEGDTLLFLLKKDARSEFEVHVFRGPQGFPHFPDKPGGDYPEDEEDEEMYVSASKEETYFPPSPGQSHEVQELNNVAFTNNLKNGKAAPFPHTKHWEKHRMHPGFRKRLTASAIPRSDGYTGQFDFPWPFMRTHGHQIHGSVKLQGIHEDSPTYLVTCRHRLDDSRRAHFVPAERCRFLKKNGLKTGHELQFSLIEESFFVVRKV